MRQPPTLLSLLAVILSSTHIAHAKPFHRDQSPAGTDVNSLVDRQSGYACGFGSLTCETADACYTDANGQAQCSTSGSSDSTQQNNANNGQYQMYTTTYTTNHLTTITSTYSSLLAAATVQVAAGGACDASIGETPCGQNPSSREPLCCAAGQECRYQGQCGISGADVDVSSAYLFSVTNTVDSPIRPTSATTETVTSTGSATTTVAFQTPSPTGTPGTTTAGMQSTTTNNGLSGGAIAGIVIGVLLGIFLLLLLCGCLCFKGILDSFLALLGLGPKRRRRTETYIEERHSHHASGGGAAAGGRRWFGQGPSRPQREKKSGVGGFGAVAGGLTALAVLLGLKRRRDRRDKSSYGTGSSYTYSDYTSSSKSPR